MTDDVLEQAWLSALFDPPREQFTICSVPDVGEVSMTANRILVNGAPPNALEMERMREFFAPLR